MVRAKFALGILVIPRIGRTERRKARCGDVIMSEIEDGLGLIKRGDLEFSQWIDTTRAVTKHPFLRKISSIAHTNV